MHACMHAYIHTYMHACIDACMHACMHACIHLCMRACMHLCMHACMHHACMHLCMHLCMYVYAHTPTHRTQGMRLLISVQHTYLRTRHIQGHMYKDTHIRTHIWLRETPDFNTAHIYACGHIYKDTYKDTCIRTYKDTCIRTHTRTHVWGHIWGDTYGWVRLLIPIQHTNTERGRESTWCAFRPTFIRCLSINLLPPPPQFNALALNKPSSSYDRQ